MSPLMPGPDGFERGEDGLRRVPNLDDPGEVHTHRIIKAIEREYGDERPRPRVVVVVEYPGFEGAQTAQDGRIAVASTGDDALDTHRMLALGIGALKAEVRAASRRN